MATMNVEGPASNSANAAVETFATNAEIGERPTSAPSQRKTDSKKLANAYKFNRVSIRRRAKYLLRKHQRKIKEQQVCSACKKLFSHDPIRYNKIR